MSTLQSLYPLKSHFSPTWIDKDAYQRLYQASIDDPDAFWAEQAETFLDWQSPWNKVKDVDYHKAHIRWFEGGKLNVAYNCIDRHLAEKGDQTALIWEGDEPDQDVNISYNQLYTQVCRLANLLKRRGIKKGDRVCIYMPMIPEVVYAMLACARIGAVHSVVFGGFSPSSLQARILDAECCAVITADEGVRGGKRVPLKENTDKALEGVDAVHSVIVVDRTGAQINWVEERDLDYSEEVAKEAGECDPVWVDAEDPLFILYTSGSTGKPKGVLHTSGGYLLYAAMTHRYIFDYRDGDVYWCTADAGWITGHSYIVYGPLANGAKTLVFEGVPTYPDASRFWKVIEKHQVNVFYTAPTAIRALMRLGNEPVQEADKSSLRILGTVGEPINPEAWHWYHDVVGQERCPVVDTWWQTETGGVLITPLPGVNELKPGAATQPFFGVQPMLLDNEGKEIQGAGAGNLVIKDSWPGQMRTVYGDHQRFIDTYFSQFPGYYCSGDGAKRDEDGHYWITGRVDDVLNISGHRLGTAEVESALVLHPAVAEAAVVGFPHDIKGQGIYAYVTLMQGYQGNDALEKTLNAFVAQQIGAIARPEFIQWAPGLPKTRSGKIMRRILRKLVEGEKENLGDTSTLAEPGVLSDLIANVRV